MIPAFGTLRVFDDAVSLALGGARFLCERAIAEPGAFVLCLSGGSTPKRLYEILASPPLLERFPWARTQFVFGDERFIPPDDPASNCRMAREAMFSRAPVPEGNIHPVPTVGLTPGQSAERYERVLRGLPPFDVCLLGLGEDGHTASLLPNEPALNERERWVGVVAHGRPETRVTLTYPALESSKAIVFLVQGEGKRDILDRVLGGDTTLPAGRLRPRGEVVWFVDRAAAGRWADQSAP